MAESDGGEAVSAAPAPAAAESDGGGSATPPAASPAPATKEDAESPAEKAPTPSAGRGRGLGGRGGARSRSSVVGRGGDSSKKIQANDFADEECIDAVGLTGDTGKVKTGFNMRHNDKLPEHARAPVRKPAPQPAKPAEPKKPKFMRGMRKQCSKLTGLHHAFSS